MLLHTGLESSYPKEVAAACEKIKDIQDFKKLASEVSSIELKEHSEAYKTHLLSQIMSFMEQRYGFHEMQTNEVYGYIAKARVFEE